MAPKPNHISTNAYKSTQVRESLTSLDFINNHDNSMLLRDVAQTLEEGRGSVVITALGLDRLNDNSSNGAVPALDQLLHLLQAALLLGLVLGRVFVQGVLERRERSLGPVERGDIELVHGLAARGGQAAEAASVEGVLEAHDGQLGGTGGGVVQARVDLLVGPLGLAALAAAVEHEGGLVGQLVGLGAGLGGEDVVESLRGGLHEAVLEEVVPGARGEVADGGSVDEGGDHLGGLGGLDEGGVVVAYRDGGDLGVAVLRTREISEMRVDWYAGRGDRRLRLRGVDLHIEVLVAVNVDNAAKESR